MTDDGLLRKLTATERPLIISTGMSSMEQIEHAVGIVGEENLLVAHATSAYPCAPEELNLRMIHTLQGMYPEVPVGYSGHETGLQTTLAAVSLGATFVERHITVDRAMWGSDQSASLEPGGLERLVGTYALSNRPWVMVSRGCTTAKSRFARSFVGSADGAPPRNASAVRRGRGATRPPPTVWRTRPARRVAGNARRRPCLSLSVPDDPIVLRTNMFFLEAIGSLVIVLMGLWASISRRSPGDSSRSSRGTLRHSCFLLAATPARQPITGGNAIFDAFFKPQFDHWAILAAEPVLAEAMKRRPMPAGYADAGNRCATGVSQCSSRRGRFQDLGVRYAYPIPDELAQEQKAEHFAPGYEAAHSLECDVAFLESGRALPGPVTSAADSVALLEERFDRSELVA